MPILTFHIKLVGTEQLVTRTFKVYSEITMYELHHTIQVVMYWRNYHLYQFDVGNAIIADSRLWDEDEMGPITDVKAVSVGEMFTKVGTTAVYEYDFGDGWMHHLELVDRSVILPEFQTKGLVKFQTSNPCINEHKTNPSPFQW